MTPNPKGALTMTIKTDDVKELLERAIKEGYPPLILINGEYYDIEVKS